MKKFAKLSDVKNHHEMRKEEMKKSKAGNYICPIDDHDTPMYSAQIAVVVAADIPGTVVAEYQIMPIADDERARSNS